jgi:TorA maturation chaperone TorD
LLSWGFTVPTTGVLSELADQKIWDEILRATGKLPKEFIIKDDMTHLQKVASGIGPSKDSKDLGVAYTSLFGPADTERPPPYETEYGQPHVFSQAQALADISGFYIAFGLQLSQLVKERPDYLGTELEFMHILMQKEEYANSLGETDKAAICADAQRTFLDDHLGRWAPPFCATLGKSNSSGFYATLGRLTLKFIDGECKYLGLEPQKVSWTPSPMTLLEEEEIGCPADRCGAEGCG